MSTKVMKNVLSSSLRNSPTNRTLSLHYTYLIMKPKRQIKLRTSRQQELSRSQLTDLIKKRRCSSSITKCHYPDIVKVECKSIQQYYNATKTPRHLTE